ncbi:hypothetical protein EWM64_g4996 [Hericium alpestre]|uniref:Uncharacterized protein n=1 Tax=Hericium alpestre TaxID=135208 RepID=A0A4Y9ZWQ7_9AGAM|nr:hypothetical protein EWM64_g4996 [Hericium alpestre]
MAVIDSFKTNTTSVAYTWPVDVSGIERIMLSAHGDLQRLLSAFFARTITINPIYAHNSPRTQLASPEHPVTQRREVHLQCSRKMVCVATSTVTITSPLCERLFLDEKFAIGQMFRRIGKVPEFALLACGSEELEDGKRKLWRRYTLSMEGFETDITEVFPDRDMFVRCEAWLDGSDAEKEKAGVEECPADEAKQRYAQAQASDATPLPASA